VRTLIVVGVLVLPLIFILNPLRICAASPEDTGAPLEWEAQYTGQTEPFQKVISTGSDFRAAVVALFRGRQLPDVDFKKNVAVCVCLGERRTGGYRIVFHSPRVEDDKLVIAYHEKRPSGFTTQALTQPCAMKIFDKKEGQEVQVNKTVDPDENRRVK